MITKVQRLLLRLSLHRRIMVFVSGILLAVFVAFGYVAWTAAQQGVAGKLEERHSTARIVARHLDDLIFMAHTQLTVAADDLAATGDLQSKQATEVLRQSLHQVQYFFSYMLVFDPQLQLVASSPAARKVSLNEDSRAMLAQVTDPGYAEVSNVLILPVEGSYGVLFVAPIIRSGQLIGVLAAEMQIPHPAVSSIAAALKLGRTGHIEVIDEKGWVLASTYPDDLVDETEHPDFYLPLVKAKQSAVGRALEREYVPGRHGQDMWHVMAFVSLSNATWGVGLGETESETFAATIDLRNRAIVVALVALVVALGCVWIGTQSVVRPIAQLTQAGERMATGDLSEPIGIVQPDEVGRLAQVLEVMRSQLQHSLDEIRAWNRELERRVSDRTKDLEISNRHLQALIAVATAASQRDDLPTVIEKSLRPLVDTLPAECAWVFLWDQKEQHLRLAADYRLPEKWRASLQSDDGHELPCVAALKSLGLENNGSPTEGPRCSTSVLEGRRCCCTPMRLGSEPFGALCLAIPPERRLTADETALLGGVARQVTMAFENARLSDEKVRLEAQRHLALLRAELLATVSHELRTPLGFIKGYASTLLRNDVSWNVGEQREFLTIIDEECDRLAELVDSLLDAARSQAGAVTLQRRQLELKPVLRRSIDRMTAMLANHRVLLNASSSPSVFADESRLEQVVVNLLQNAAKYSTKGDTIEVRLETVGQEARVGVFDEGVGVPADQVERVFEPFYRIGDSSIPGAGLGLAICRAIMEAHGGRIWAEVRAARGTVIYFTLPTYATDDEEKVDGQEAGISG